MANDEDVQSVTDYNDSPHYVRVSLQTRCINISRPVYDQASFDRQFVGKDASTDEGGPSTPLRDRVRSLLPSCDRSTPGDICRRVVRYLPVVEHLRNYRWRSWLLGDILAGVSSGVIHVPQGMGFALLAGLPTVYGLYGSIYPGWVYYLFGTSRHLSVGTMALTAMMVGDVVARIVPDVATDIGQQNMEFTPMTSWTTSTTGSHVSRDVTYDDMTSPMSSNEDVTAMKVGVAMSVTLIAGLFQMAMRICRLGVICTFMSMPFIVAFLTASATQIIVSQIPFELGLEIDRPLGYFVVPLTVVEIFRHITETNVCALIVSIISIAFLVTIKEYINERFKKKLKIPIPAELLLVILTTIVSHFGRLNERYALPVIGNIPLGLPAPRVPPMTAAGSYIVDGVVVGVVGFVIVITMARLMAERHSYEVDNDQELLACSLCNTISSFFGCFVATQAPPRTLVHEAAGGRTQLAGAVSTLVPLLVVLALGSLFESLPISVLGCITSCAILPLMKQFTQLRWLWQINRFDFVVWISTYVCTAFVSITIGLAFGVALTCLLAIVQARRVHGQRLTRAADTEIYYYSRPPTATTTTCSATMPVGVVVYRVGGPIFFANVDKFVDQLYSDVLRPSDVKQELLVYTTVSAGRHEFDDDDSGKLTNPNSVEMNELHSSNKTDDGFECTTCENVQGSAATTNSHEATDLNDNTEEDGAPQHCGSSNIRVIVLDCSRVTFVDSMAVAALKKVNTSYRNVGIQLVLSGCDAKVTAVMAAACVIGDTKRHIEMYPTVHDAVVAVG